MIIVAEENIQGKTFPLNQERTSLSQYHHSLKYETLINSVV